MLCRSVQRQVLLDLVVVVVVASLVSVMRAFAPGRVTNIPHLMCEACGTQG